MSARRAVWEVARREVVERSRSRVWRISLVLILVLSVGGAVAGARLSGRTPTDHNGLVGARSVALEPAIRVQAAADGRRARLHRLADTPAAARALRDGTVAVALIDGRRLMVRTTRPEAAIRVVQSAVAAHGVFQQLRRSGLDEASALEAVAPRALPVGELEPNARNTEENRALVVIGALALFMALIFYCQAVAQGVTEEKSTRVVELLLTTIAPRRLLAGKVLGIGALGLAQVLVAGGAALLAGTLAGGAGLPAAAPEAIGLVLLWFVLGYAFYSVAFAAVGALVSRQEDLQTAMLPINAVLIASFYIALIVANGDHDGTLAQVATFLPPFAPMVVPASVVLGDMGVAGLVLAVALELVAIVALIVLAARIYERAILRTGAPLKLRRLFAKRSRWLGRAASSR
jgi:ABC-2 type transport system permease protein